jgi:hypothetical protein
MTFRMTAAVASLILVAAVGAAFAAPPAERVIGRKSTSGDFAVAAASGAVNKPVLVRVRLAALPNQPAQVTWKLRCTKGKSAAIRQGQFRATTPHDRLIRFPMTKPTRCSASASAQLERQGRITVTLLAR